jgi:hypothetical protein
MIESLRMINAVAADFRSPLAGTESMGLYEDGVRRELLR